MLTIQSLHRALLASCLLGCLPARAGSAISTPATPGIPETPASTATGLLLGKFTGESAYDRIWSAFTLYKDENNPVLQEFSLKGRLQVQYADGYSNGHFDIEDYKELGGKDESVWGDHFEARRLRLGFKSKWFQNWKFNGEINVDTDGRDGVGGDHTLYKDLFELYLTYAPADTFNVSIGKVETHFGREYEISANEILTFERSLVTNLLFAGELTGAWVTGKGVAQHWLYECGVYGNDRVREFSNFDQGAIFLAKIGYDYASQAGLDTAVASLHYLHNTEPGFKSAKTDPNFSFSSSPSFTDAIALTNDITQGRFGLITDIFYAFGYVGNAEQGGVTKAINQSDVFGITLIPSYFIANGLQLVGRLQYACSADPNGLSLPGRYEDYAPPTPKKDKGDSYASAYLGLNYYIYSHKLKIMNGIEYSHLGGGDYDGYTFFSGLRFSF